MMHCRTIAFSLMPQQTHGRQLHVRLMQQRLCVPTTIIAGSRTADAADAASALSNLPRNVDPSTAETITKTKAAIFLPTRRYFSDRLLGHSPMAAPTVSHSSSNIIPTQQDVSMSGGVWAQTSAKRDALAELKAEAAAQFKDDHDGDKTTTTTLDDMATAAQKLDLCLADGMQLVAKVADEGTAAAAAAAVDGGEDDFVRQQLETWWNELECWQTKKKQDDSDKHLIGQVEWEEMLRSFIKQTDAFLSTLPADRYLQHIRDFMPIPEELIQGDNDHDDQAVSSSSSSSLWPPSSPQAQEVLAAQARHFEHAVLRFRLLLAKAAAEQLLESWSLLTTNTDQQVDRAAVAAAAQEKEQHNVELSTALSMEQLETVLQAFWKGSCSERVDALWRLRADNVDGLLDQDQMNLVCDLAIQPTGQALSRLFAESLEARPVRLPLPEWSDDVGGSVSTSQTTELKPMSWRQRRQDRRLKKRLSKMFGRTVQYHFRDEVEQAHRLRCIYAWANKEHQNNKIDSVLVENEAGLGRKRYVELHPLIRLPEFREVQHEHFTHLDRVGQEFIKSFREDLLVWQGKGRQRRELVRDSALFLAVVSLVDFVIVSL